MHFPKLLSISLVLEFLIDLFDFFVEYSLLLCLCHSGLDLARRHFRVHSELVGRGFALYFRGHCVKCKVKTFHFGPINKIFDRNSEKIVHELWCFLKCLNIPIHLKLFCQNPAVFSIHWVDYLPFAWRLRIISEMEVNLIRLGIKLLGLILLFLSLHTTLLRPLSLLL